MSKLAYNLVVKMSEYQDRTGQTKAKWLTIGSMWANNNGYFLVLEPHINLAALPRGDKGGVLVSCFEPRDQAQPMMPGRRIPDPSSAGNNFEDDVPF